MGYRWRAVWTYYHSRIQMQSAYGRGSCYRSQSWNRKAICTRVVKSRWMVYSLIFADTDEMSSILRPSRCRFRSSSCPNLHLDKLTRLVVRDTRDLPVSERASSESTSSSSG